ncbi:MAG: aminopeptidase P family protein [Phycisphaerales bacterium]|nr:MAG: aminopeptidase P family protein [Phycisphaerales bacterium]
MKSIIAEKVEQAGNILRELQIDAWLTFVRETTETGDPVLPLILGRNLTWYSALIITRSGERVAIVGQYDDGAVKSVGIWAEVIPYVEGIREPLVDTLRRLDPQKLAVNFSRDDVTADGLSHGMFLALGEYLADTPYGDRLVSAENIIAQLRGRKSAGEIQRIRSAIATTDRIFDEVAGFATPGKTERDVARFMHDLVEKQNLDLAWDRRQCPTVNTGPESMIGHGIPSELAIEPGHIFHIDFGVRQDDYCSDIQRCWYVPRRGETEPPEAVRRVFDTVVAAIQAAAATIKPGVECWKVDAAARQTVVDAGYPEYRHATGHSIGRSAHDGGSILGPKWERYGQLPYRKLEEGNVFTLELGIENVDGCGYLGLEEMIVVTAGGCEYLSRPQTVLPLLQ